MTITARRRALVLWVAGAAAAQAMVAAGVSVARAATPRATTDAGRLFRIAKAGVPDSFVLGTIHTADARVAVIEKPVAAALARSRTLAVELVPEAHDAQLLELEQSDGERLDALVGRDAYARLRAELLARDVPAAAVERLKPWAAMLKVARSAPGQPAPALDDLLFSEARKQRINILPLELLEEQIAAFDTIPREAQLALLMHALDHRAALEANTEATTAAWLRGDLGALSRIALHADGPFAAMRPHYAQLVAHIIHGRTALMHHRLFMPLRSGRVFVAIGALHLHGEKGLLALLRKDGYRATRVW